MLVSDALSHYALLYAPEILLDTTINHVHITPDKKNEFQALIQDDPLLCSLAEVIIAGWPDDINDVPHALCLYHVHRNTLIVEDGLILQGESLIIPLSGREKILQTIHERHMGIIKCQNSVYWPQINSDIKCLIESCPICQCHCPQESQQLLQPTPAPEHPMQLLSTDYFHFHGSEYLVVTDDYSKKTIVKRIPASQCNASKAISVLKELFAEHGIPETLHTDNGPQLANALFTTFATDWKFDYNTSTPRNPRSNDQAEAAIKTVKGLLTNAKCSGEDPYLALLAYHSMPIDAHLHSPAEMTSECYAPLCHNRSGTLTCMPMLNVTTSTNMTPKVQSTTTSKAATRKLHSLPAKPYLSSMMPGTCGSLPPSSTKLIMAHTWSKSLAVDSTDMHVTTFKNVI